MDRQDLISKIEAYSAVSKLKPSTICQYALSNRRFYDNLRAGKDYQVGTGERLLGWMQKHPPAERKGAA